MAATIDDTKHRVYIANGTNDAERLDSMIGEGPLYILSGHILDRIGGSWLPAPVNGRIHLGYHLMEYITLQAFKFSANAMAVGQGWFIGTPMLSHIFAELDAAGIPSQPEGLKHTRQLNPLNFAAQWVRYELTYPCPVGQRATWAAFSPTGESEPFTTRRAREALHLLMVAMIGAIEAALRSWHAFRVTIACALMARPEYKANPQAQEALIQCFICLVRWKTPESVRRYAHMLPNDYADHVDSVTTTDGHHLRDMAHSVTIDATEGLADIDAAIKELEAEIERAKKRRSTNAKIIAGTAIGTLDAETDGGNSTSGATARTEDKAEKRKSTAKGNEAIPPTAGPVLETFDCGEAGKIKATAVAPEKFGEISIPNSVWGMAGTTRATVVGYAAEHEVSGAKSKGAYVVFVASEDTHYVMDSNFYVFKKKKRQKL